MEIKASAKSIKISPRKVRLVASVIRKNSVQKALDILSLTEKRSAYSLIKIIKSAVANATHNSKLSADILFIKSIEVSDGTALKRFHPSTKGRVHPYKKRSSNITIILEEKKGIVIWDKK